jgi:hypothetical protein
MAVGALILLLLAFYGGRVYQNNVDQKLFNEYNPPTTGRAGGSAFGSGGGLAAGGTGQSSLVRAALGAGSPPGTRSASGSSSSTGGSSAGSTSSAQTNRVTGSLGSLSQTSLSVQTFQGGTQSIPVTSQTRFYQNQTASTSALKPGEQVTVQASGSSAVSITIGPAQLATGGRRFGGGGFGGGGSLTRLTGTLSRVGNGTIKLTGRSGSISFNGSTRISRIVSIQPSQLQTGDFVTVTTGAEQGRQTALMVVARSGGFGGGNFSGPNG